MGGKFHQWHQRDIVLFGTNNKILGHYLAAIHRILTPVMHVTCVGLHGEERELLRLGMAGEVY
jgi:hypothetical protein